MTLLFGRGFGRDNIQSEIDTLKMHLANLLRNRFSLSSDVLEGLLSESEDNGCLGNQDSDFCTHGRCQRKSKLREDISAQRHSCATTTTLLAPSTTLPRRLADTESERENDDISDVTTAKLLPRSICPANEGRGGNPRRPS